MKKPASRKARQATHSAIRLAVGLAGASSAGVDAAWGSRSDYLHASSNSHSSPPAMSPAGSVDRRRRDAKQSEGNRSLKVHMLKLSSSDEVQDESFSVRSRYVLEERRSPHVEERLFVARPVYYLWGMEAGSIPDFFAPPSDALVDFPKDEFWLDDDLCVGVDCEVDCLIPDNFKSNSAVDVMEYLGLRRAKPLDVHP
jgi:hypothetical protein